MKPKKGNKTFFIPINEYKILNFDSSLRRLMERKCACKRFQFSEKHWS